MATTLTSTGVTFPDSTAQTTASKRVIHNDYVLTPGTTTVTLTNALTNQSRVRFVLFYETTSSGPNSPILSVKTLPTPTSTTFSWTLAAQRGTTNVGNTSTSNLLSQIGTYQQPTNDALVVDFFHNGSGWWVAQGFCMTYSGGQYLFIANTNGQNAGQTIYQITYGTGSSYTMSNFRASVTEWES